MEYRKRCQVCGKVFCYTDKDLNENITNAGLSALSAIGSLASIFGGGTIFHTSYHNQNSQHYGDKVVDFNKCPSCGSTNLVFINENEWQDSQKQIESGVQNVRRVEINSNATPEMLLKRAAMFLEDEEWSNADAYAEAVLDVEPENAMAYMVKMMGELKVKELAQLPQCKKPFDDNSNYKKALRFGDEETRTFLTNCISDINERIKNEKLEKAYRAATNEMQKARTEEEYCTAGASFLAVGGYKDAEKLSEECYKKAEDARKDEIYNRANTLMKGNDSATCRRALDVFESVRGWRDTDELIDSCKEKISMLEKAEEQHRKDEEAKAKKGRKNMAIGAGVASLITVAILVVVMVIMPNMTYNSAVSLMENGSYDEAIAKFQSLDGAKDSATLIKECEYLKAVSVMEVGNFEEALAKFEALGNYNDSKKLVEECKVGIKEQKYNNAVNLFEQGKYTAAYEIFVTLGSYKDSGKKIAKVKELSIKNPSVGDTVWFGSYEQDKSKKGKEEIEWQVIDKEGNKVLLISKSALAVKSYHNNAITCTWEISKLREWLNKTFINEAFSNSERSKIKTTKIVSNNSQGKSTTVTEDKVFVLSKEEYEASGLETYAVSKIVEEEYTYYEGSWADRVEGQYHAWLRTTWHNSLYVGVANATNNGEIRSEEAGPKLCILPAMWITID